MWLFLTGAQHQTMKPPSDLCHLDPFENEAWSIIKFPEEQHARWHPGPAWLACSEQIITLQYQSQEISSTYAITKMGEENRTLR